MKKIALALIAVMTVGCADQFKTKTSPYINDSLRPYLNTFLTKAIENGVALDISQLSMQFSESMPASTVPNASTIGYCSRGPDTASVMIKESYWKTAGVSEREELVFHELGHCLLGLQHDNSTQTAIDYYGYGFVRYNTPNSIMNELHFDKTIYEGNRNAYIKELFTGIVSQLYYNAPSQFGINEYLN